MKRKLLLVIDMQNDFITGALGNEECRKVVPHVIERMKYAKEQGWNILCTQDTHGENYLQTGEGRRLPVKHCIKGTKGYELIDEIKALEEAWRHEGEVFLPLNPVEKNAFGSTALSKELGRYQIEEVELIGVCTDICVLSNALILRSDYPDMEVSVNAHCCAGVTPQSHETALNAMEGCQINVIRK